MNRNSPENNCTLIWRPVLLGVVLLSLAVFLLETQAALSPHPPESQCKPAFAYHLIRLGLLAIFHAPLLGWRVLLRSVLRIDRHSTHSFLLSLRMPIATWGAVCLSVAIHYWPLISQTNDSCNHS